MKDLQLVNYYKLKPGDRIVIPKSGLHLVQHHALYLGCDDFGNHYVCENVIHIGVKLTKVQDFFREGRFTRIERYTGNNYERKKVVQNALSKLGKPYNLINYNCESFVNDALYSSAKSSQVANVFGILALLVMSFLAIGAATSNNKK